MKMNRGQKGIAIKSTNKAMKDETRVNKKSTRKAEVN